jgi:two-component system phosphate regulon sensor histidine kinase PhoR
MTIFRKNLINFGCLTLFLILLLIISIPAFMNSLYYEANARALSSTASALLSAFSEEYLREYFAAGETGKAFPYEEKQYRLTLIDKNGYVLWDSQVEHRMVNHMDREEVYTALEGREGRALRKSTNTGTRQLYTALPVFGMDGLPAGIFRLSMEVSGFWQRLAPIVLPILFITAILVFAAFFGVYNFSRSLSLSLERLVNIALETEDFHFSAQRPKADNQLEGDVEELVTLEKALRGMSSEFKLRLKEARTEGRQLETILNSMSEAVIATDNSLLLLLVNPCARKLFNLEDCLKDRNILIYSEGNQFSERNTFSFRKRLSLLEATHSTELEWTARKVLETGKSEELEIKFHTTGTEQRFQVSVTPLPSEPAANLNTAGTGLYGGIVIVMEDLTHIARLEQIRKDFVANVSHELRTPIQLMKGFSETLLDSPIIDAREGDTAGKEQFRHFIEIIRKNANTMENLINDLLSLANLEDENSVRPDKEELELAPLFEEAVYLVDIPAKKKQTEIVIDCPPDLRAKLYGSYIIQALVNLLDNAIKYSPGASRIWLRAFSDNGELIMEVKDQGIGISAEHHERIFERFYRIDQARSRDAGGTGLGLAIVRHIALLHGGKAEFESHAGDGSTFRIRIKDN